MISGMLVLVARLAIATLVWSALVACGGGRDDASLDGGRVDGGGLAPVAAPDIPWLADGVPPVGITPCPAGWREITDEPDVVGCHPYPVGGPSECAFGEAHFPGESGCRPIGDPCPAGEWSSSVPTSGPVVYVSADAPLGGDGSRAAPHAALSAVPWLSLAPGTTVAIGKGRYEGTLRLGPGVRVIGACVAETLLSGVTAPVPAVVTAARAGEAAIVRNVAIVDPPQFGVLVETGGNIELEGVLVESALGLGIVASDGAQVVLRDLVVARTRPDTRVPGRGIELQSGTRVEATRIIVVENLHGGVVGHGVGTEIVLSDAVVRDTRPVAGEVGRGIEIGDGARLHATRLLLSRNHDMGLLAVGAGTLAVVSEAVVEATQPTNGGFGRGLHAIEGARIEAFRAFVTGNHSVGVFAQHPGTELVLTDVVVRETQAVLGGEGGRGINLQAGAHLAASRVVVTGNRDIGILGTGDGVEMVLDDVTVRRTIGRASDDAFGRGIGAQDAARLMVSRALVAENSEVGVFATEAVVELTDVVVRGTESAGDRTGGRGIAAQGAARLGASRVLVTGSREVGISGSQPGTELLLTDVEVRETRGDALNLVLGTGLGVEVGARVSGQRVRVVEARECGLVAIDGASIDLTDVSVANVDISECECGRIFGYGVAAVSGTIRLSRFEVRDATTCGLLVATPPFKTGTAASLDVESGIVEGAAIGACVQVDGYDLSRLMHDVAYQRNGSNLQSTMLPVPTPSPALDP